MKRREYIAGAATGAGMGIAGCLGGEDNSSPDSVSLPDGLPKTYDEIPKRRIFNDEAATREDALKASTGSWVYTDEVTYLDDNDEETTLYAGMGNVFLTITVGVWNSGGDAVMPPGAEQFGFVNTPTVDEMKVVAPSMKFPEGVTWSDIVFDEDDEYPLEKPTFVNPNTYYHEIEGGTNRLQAQTLTLLFHCSKPIDTTFLRWHSDQQIEGSNKPVFFELKT